MKIHTLSHAVDLIVTNSNMNVFFLFQIYLSLSLKGQTCLWW